MEDIVIIGNGAAANSAAETIRKHDPQVPIIMVAQEKLPEYSACALPDCLSGWVNREKLFIKQLADYEHMAIQTKFGIEIDEIDIKGKKLAFGSEKIAYQQLIIATGSRPIIPPVPGHDLPGNFAVKTVADIDAIIAYQPKKVVVVGSGNIGIEVAEALQLRGCEVSIVELMESILPRIFDEEPARRISKLLIDKGIKIFTRERVIGVKGDQRVEAVATQSRSIACDTVIWAVGIKQNVELAVAAGVKPGELGGLQVNPRMQTNIDGIYACGDCIESINRLTGHPSLSLLWPNAVRQGQVAALNCLGLKAEYEGAVNLVVEDIYGVTAVSMGMTSAALAGENVQVLEGQNNEQYWRFLVLDDRIMGGQTIGISSGLGAAMAMMKSRTTLSEYRAVVKDTALSRRMAWYLPVQQYLAE